MTRPKTETHLHFVGIGGIGMSGIAEVFLNQGYRVSGSDLQESESTRRLARLGAKILLGHQASNVQGAHVVVMSSAVKKSNPEIQEAARQRIPVIPRAEMLGELMRGKTGIAVAGSHGKTTTTSMLATVFTLAGKDPTLVIGGRVDSLGGNAKLGQGPLVIAEADESDGSFLHLPATYGIITNVDNDHLDHFKTTTAIDQAFVDFVGKMPFYGHVVVCGEDAGVRRCLQSFTKPFSTYGISGEYDWIAEGIQFGPSGSEFDVFRKSESGREKLGRLKINVPGRHNVLNALAVCGLGTRLGLTFEEIAHGLRSFHGVKRRFETRFEDQAKKITVIDDYGHHPTEIQATLAAAKNYWKGRILVVFQPHRYSRTLHCYDQFMKAFTGADRVWITDIYSAGEDPIDGISGKKMVSDLKVKNPSQDFFHLSDLENGATEILNEVKSGDLVLCLGAGSITKLPDRLAQGLS
ncbi:MAG: UDP-N-acetylmuramate--L-alanine ligase [Bdellovibrionales bacterium]|nr:UDP-N-acetylmuramate--L-alanine ligase [Bdellovibrionales bacterium]